MFGICGLSLAGKSSYYSLDLQIKQDVCQVISIKKNESPKREIRFGWINNCCFSKTLALNRWELT